MNNYIMKKTSVNGTEVKFLETLRNFFTTNSIMPFTLESENLTNTEGEANFIRLKNNDFIFEFLSTATSSTNTATLKLSLYRINESNTSIASQILTYTNQITTREKTSAKSFPIFLVKGDNIEFIFVGNFNSSYGKSNGFYHLKSGTSETGLITAFSSSQTNSFNFTDYETHSIDYAIAPYHTTSTAVDTLIMDSELALKTKEDNFYCGTILDCYGLGGGIKGMFYKDSNDILLYCFETNACFKLENKVEF